MAFSSFLPLLYLPRKENAETSTPNRPDPIAAVPSAVPSAGLITASCARDSIKA
jgi:hypothetical protein